MTLAESSLSNSMLHLPDYILVEQIYEGACTRVYRAVEKVGQRPVMIKVMQQKFPTLHDLLQFRNQYTIAKSLDLPGVVCPYRLEPYGNSYALVMEDFGGISLETYAQGRAMTFSEVLAIALQLADILHGLHQRRVIHKDLKPANVLIHPDSKQIKLIDFSIASLLPRETQKIQNPTGLEGTLAYLSPEQTGRMNRGIDYRSDFYAFGVVLYELLTGQLPFQCDDPMEFVYCHLAKLPIAPHHLNPEIPIPVSEIVLKLMAKKAEDRYQTALGLKHDLANCVTQWQATGGVQPFVLGQRDVSDRFTIPEKLYGREAEVKTLLKAFDRICQGTPELLLIVGSSGIGKTALVNEIHKPLCTKRNATGIGLQCGYFIKGKFDQLNRDIPFSAFVQAFRDLIRQLLLESNPQQQHWKTQILQALGDSAQIMVDLIPELACLIGEQPPAPALLGIAAQSRFNLLLKRFIRVFALPAHPLVMFLDDLQWADAASLKLMQGLMAESQTGCLLLIGAYRENEVSAHHPLMLTLDEMRQGQTRIQTIALRPLSQTSLNQWVAETLHCTESLAQPLTALVYQKTNGNPFFATQFLKALHQEQWIIFDREAGQWRFDLNQGQNALLTEDVVAFMVQQLRKLPPATQAVLKLAACIGNQFDLRSLAIVSEQSPASVATALWAALQEGLILPQSQIYKFYWGDAKGIPDENSPALKYQFLHDRVQQAAYSLIPDPQKQQTHLKIGRLLRQEQAGSDNLFEILGHLNLSTALITDSQERRSLARLNLVGCQRAKNATDYGAAVRYATVAIRLLPSNPWQTDVPFVLQLYEAAAEAAYLNTEFARAEGLTQTILQHCDRPLDRMKSYERLIQIHIAQDQQLQAIATGLEALDQLGISLIQRRDWSVDLPQLPSSEDLAKAATMSDPAYLAALKILITLTPPVHHVKPDLFPAVVLTMVELCDASGTGGHDRGGYSGWAAYVYGIYGLLLCSRVGDFDRAYRAGQVSLALLEQYPARDVQTKANMLFAVFVCACKEPGQATLPYLKQGIEIGLDVGDIEHVSYSIMAYFTHLFLVGQPLEEIKQAQQNYLPILEQFKQEHCIEYSKLWLKITDELTASNGLSADAASDAQVLERFEQTHNHQCLFAFHLAKLITGYIAGDYETALNHATQALANQDAAFGILLTAAHTFYHSLVLLALSSPEQPLDQSVLEQVSANQTKLKRFADHAPSNYLHKFELVAAELCRVRGQKNDALLLYDRAIAGAKANHYLQEAALANERAAQFYLDWGKEKIAAGYLQDAYYGYGCWGAIAKTDALELHDADLLRPILQTAVQPLNLLAKLVTITLPAHSSQHRSTPSQAPLSLGSTPDFNSSLDFVAVLKAAQSLAGTIQLEELLHQLTQLILQYSGGDRCVLVGPNAAGDWQIAAIATPKTTQLRAIPLDRNPNLPISLIHYVKNTQETVVIDELKTDLPVVDGYLARQHPQSLLGLPILNKGQLIGILVLENRSTRGVFTSDRLLILNFLCTQAAISWENARLYQESQGYAQQLEQSLQALQVTQNQLRANEHLMQNQALALVQLSESKAISQGHLREAFQELTRVTAELLQVERVSVWLTDEQQTQIQCMELFQRSLQHHSQGIVLKLSDYPLYFSAVVSEPILSVNDARTDPRTAEFRGGCFDVFNISSILDASVHLNGEIAGILSCEHVGEQRVWSQAEQTFIRSIANLIALTLESNQRHQKAEKLKEVLLDLEQSQIQTIQNEKMASLGNLVAGVAHEINNPLGFLSGSITNGKDYVQDLLEHLALYQQHYPDPEASIQDHAETIDLEFLSEDLPKLLDTMQGATDRIRSISMSLRTFSRADTERTVRADLHEGIDSTLLILKYRLKATQFRPEIEVRKDYGQLPLVDCFPGQLNQVFMNILANAIDMFDEMAKMRSSPAKRAHPQCIEIQTAVVADQVQIRIRDNGAGMSEDVQARIFDHLFTTKSVGKGTGLGLAIARQIVEEKHGGSISVHSIVAKGSEFVIHLPLQTDPDTRE